MYLHTALIPHFKFLISNCFFERYFSLLAQRKVTKRKGTSRGGYSFVTEMLSPKSARVRRPKHPCFGRDAEADILSASDYVAFDFCHAIAKLIDER